MLPTAQAGGFQQSRVGLPASLRLALLGFHRTGSYGLSTGEDGLPSRHTVPGSIDSSIMMGATLRAGPLTDSKREGVEYMTTVEAALTGGVPSVTLDQGSTIPVGFVVELGHELRPCDITHSVTQGWMLDHVLDCQRLNTHDVVLAYESGRACVQEVTAAICDAGMKASDVETSLVSVLRAFALLGMAALGLRKLLLIFVKERGIAHHLTIGEDDKGLQTKISTSGRIDGGKMRDLVFDQDADARSDQHRLW